MGLRKASLPALGLFIMGLGTVYYFTTRKDNTDSQRYVNKLNMLNYEKTHTLNQDLGIRDSLFNDRYINRRFQVNKTQKVTTKDPFRKESIFFERDDNENSINSRKSSPLQSADEENKVAAITTLKTTTVRHQERTNLAKLMTGNLFQIQSENNQRDSVILKNVPSNLYENLNNRNDGNVLQNVDRNVILSQGVNNPSRGNHGNFIKVINRNPSNNVPSYVSDELKNANDNMNTLLQNQNVRQPPNLAGDAFIQTLYPRQPTMATNTLPVQQPGIVGQPGNQMNQHIVGQLNPVNRGVIGIGQTGNQAQDSIANQLANVPQYSVNRLTGLSVGGNNLMPGQQGNLLQQNYNQNVQQNNIGGHSTTGSGLPSREEIARMDFATLSAIYHRYVNTKQETCNRMVRVGNIQDGGWDICDDERYRPKSDCKVLSFGINNDFSFDDDISRRYGCQVHCFDPSMKVGDHRRSSYIYFHATGLSSEDNFYNNWPMKRLSTIRRDLGWSQTPIDILKIDIEMWELPVIPEMVKSGSMKDIKQFVVEIHLDLTEGRVLPPREKYEKAFDCLRYLYDDGFRIVYTHRNPYCLMKQHKGKDKRWGCHEISFVRS